MTGSLGVCSWSLRPASPADLCEKVRACGMSAVQLALDPLRTGAWDPNETTDTLAAQGLRVLSGMMTTAGEDYSTLATIRQTGGVRPDATWEQNLAAARANADLAARLGLRLVTLHAGFIPHDRTDPEWAKLVERVRTLCDVFADAGLRLGLETGQETPGSLLDALDAIDRPNLGVNFDPANMILYDMGDPVEALTRLSVRVEQVHIKDATRTRTPGAWGSEVPAGSGEVDWPAFFELLRYGLPDADLLIEREAGDQRTDDVRAAAALVRRHADWIDPS